jgi:hypothetical protein
MLDANCVFQGVSGAVSGKPSVKRFAMGRNTMQNNRATVHDIEV